MATFQGKPLKDLFSEFKQSICKFVVDAIDKIQSQNPTSKVSLDIVLEVASVFEFKDLHSFLKVEFQFKLFLSYLLHMTVMNCFTPKSSKLETK